MADQEKSRELIKNVSIFNTNNDTSAYENITKFDGLYPHMYKEKFVGGPGFVFFTKPKLFINPIKPGTSGSYVDMLAYKNMCNDSFFSMFLNNEAINDLDKELINNLSYTSEGSNFIKLLTNECKNFDPQDVNIATDDAFTTKQGYRMPLPTHATETHGTGQISFNMDETANLDITKLISLWWKYIENITDGTFSVHPDSILNNELDYMCSIYYFLLSPDGATIKFWAKYTGCYPVNVPYSPFGWHKGETNQVELNVTFNYILKEEMDPRIFEDFNRVSLHKTTVDDTSDNIDSDYTSFKESPLLAYDKLVNLSSVQDKNRDPIVFFNDVSSKRESAMSAGSVSKKFELSFGENNKMSSFYSERFDIPGVFDSDTYKSVLNTD